MEGILWEGLERKPCFDGLNGTGKREGGRLSKTESGLVEAKLIYVCVGHFSAHTVIGSYITYKIINVYFFLQILHVPARPGNGAEEQWSVIQVELFNRGTMTL